MRETRGTGQTRLVQGNDKRAVIAIGGRTAAVARRSVSRSGGSGAAACTPSRGMTATASPAVATAAPAAPEAGRAIGPRPCAGSTAAAAPGVAAVATTRTAGTAVSVAAGCPAWTEKVRPRHGTCPGTSASAAGVTVRTATVSAGAVCSARLAARAAIDAATSASAAGDDLVVASGIYGTGGTAPTAGAKVVPAAHRRTVRARLAATPHHEIEDLPRGDVQSAADYCTIATHWTCDGTGQAAAATPGTGRDDGNRGETIRNRPRVTAGRRKAHRIGHAIDGNGSHIHSDR